MNHIFIWFLFLETENSFKFTKTENSAKALYQTETVFEKLLLKIICCQRTLNCFLKLFFYNLRITKPRKIFQKMLPKRPVNFNTFSISDKSNTTILK
jgi:hypothetical protein